MSNMIATGVGVLCSLSRNIHPFRNALLGAACFVVSASVCLAQSELARFLPAGAPVLAGLHRLAPDEAKDALWLATRNNADDLNRLVQLTDHDPGRTIEQVIVADWPSHQNRLDNHLLIAQGRFSLARVYPAGEKLRYRGLDVLAIETSGGSQPPLRWLATPQRDIALFGNPAAVQLALDRFLSGAHPDPALLERMKGAQAHHAAWSSVLLAASPLKTTAALTAGDSFSACLQSMGQVDLDVQFGSAVTLNLHMQPRTASPTPGSSGTMQCVSEALFGRNTPQMRIAFAGERRAQVRATMKRPDYDVWLDSFRRSRTSELMQAMISGSGSPAESQASDIQSLR